MSRSSDSTIDALASGSRYGPGPFANARQHRSWGSGGEHRGTLPGASMPCGWRINVLKRTGVAVSRVRDEAPSFSITIERQTWLPAAPRRGHRLIAGRDCSETHGTEYAPIAVASASRSHGTEGRWPLAQADASDQCSATAGNGGV